MSFICTADLQAEWNNLDQCEQAWNEILHQCEKRKLKIICVIGDGKEAYNPIDGKVITWWQGAIIRAKKKGYKVLFVRGNHDRFGQHSDTENWLPILRRAGAETFDNPSVYATGEERLFILPYSNNASLRIGAEKLLKEKPDKTKDILLFHCDLKSAKYNRQGSRS